MLNYFASLYFGMVLGYAVGRKQMEGKIKKMEENWNKKEKSYKDIISDNRVLEFGVETNKK